MTSRSAISSRQGAEGLWEADGGSSSVVDACASAVAARGVMFSNTHPAPSRFLPLGAPALYQVERARAGNATCIHTQLHALALHGMLSLATLSASSFVSEGLPCLRMLTCSPYYFWIQPTLPSKWLFISGGKLVDRQYSAHATSQLPVGTSDRTGIEIDLGQLSPGGGQAVQKEEDDDPIDDA
eukprot:gene32115-16632_t